MIDREQVHLREIARLDAERLRMRQEVERLRGLLREACDLIEEHHEDEPTRPIMRRVSAIRIAIGENK